MTRLDACHRARHVATTGPRNPVITRPIPSVRRPHTAAHSETQPDPAGPGTHRPQDLCLRKHPSGGSGPRCAIPAPAEPGPRGARAADLPGSGPPLAHRHRERSTADCALRLAAVKVVHIKDLHALRLCWSFRSGMRSGVQTISLSDHAGAQAEPRRLAGGCTRALRPSGRQAALPPHGQRRHRIHIGSTRGGTACCGLSWSCSVWSAAVLRCCMTGPSFIVALG